jgi:hypothetical protein
MATTIPSTAAIARMWAERNFTRLRQIEDDNNRLQLEDYRTISTDRGPVKGYSGGRGSGI